jgi:AhpD family alkylhydroperoxidase
MTLTMTEREVAAIGASVGAGCQPCLEYHVVAGARAGLAPDALLKAIEDAECVKRDAQVRMAGRARDLLGLAGPVATDCCDDSNRAKELAAVGSAIGANSVANLRKHVAAAIAVGVSLDELDQAIAAARAVQDQAARLTAGEATSIVMSALPMVPAAPALGDSPASACGPDCACGDSSSAQPAVASGQPDASCGCATSNTEAGVTAACC